MVKVQNRAMVDMMKLLLVTTEEHAKINKTDGDDETLHMLKMMTH